MKKHGGNLKVYYTEWKKPIWNGSILYDSNYITFWKKQKGDHNVCQGLEGRERGE